MAGRVYIGPRALLPRRARQSELVVVETLQSSEKQQAAEAGLRRSTAARPAQVGSDLPTTTAKLPR